MSALLYYQKQILLKHLLGNSAAALQTLKLSMASQIKQHGRLFFPLYSQAGVGDMAYVKLRDAARRPRQHDYF